MFLKQGMAQADIENFLNSCYIEFKLSGKVQWGGQANELPAAGGLTGFAAYSAAGGPTFEAQNGSTLPGVMYPLTVEGRPIFIRSQQLFEVIATFSNAVAFTAAFEMTLKLQGVSGQAIVG